MCTACVYTITTYFSALDAHAKGPAPVFEPSVLHIYSIVSKEYCKDFWILEEKNRDIHITCAYIEVAHMRMVPCTGTSGFKSYFLAIY